MSAVRRALLQARGALRRSGDRTPAHDYRPGEDVRDIDWAASARAGSPQIRARQLDASFTWSAIVDRSPSMNVGRRRTLAAAAGDALEFWRACGGAKDTWIELPAVKQLFDLRVSFECALKRLPPYAALLVAGDFHEFTAVPPKAFSRLARRFDCTALIARDPWHDGLPLGGLQRVRYAETVRQPMVYIGPRERERYRDAVRRRERDLTDRLLQAGWRTGVLAEEDGKAGLLRAFGMR